ncbi:hypothetical protein [Clostridium sp. BJN0001]|uniref:hypothetical protein n=1 Tax=Clostridium sp. BJN0001 TaxID=2930219 RepID=UPI001FD2836E|nr:hypothetical protein [Clostridium sp. BJN0001]
MKAKCIKGFALEKCDDNGFTIENEYFTVEDNSIWNIENNEDRFIGGEIRLTNDNGEWLEISKETLKEHFEKMSKTIQELIDYLEAVKKESGSDTKILIAGEVVEDFEDVISVDHVKDEIDFISNGYTY